jgi:hypothetical protein
MATKKAKAITRKLHKSKAKWDCVDCSENTSYEHYFVTNDVWMEQAKMGEAGMLCVPCLELRIGRRLGPADFTDAHINNPKTHPMTIRLQSRILG